MAWEREKLIQNDYQDREMRRMPLYMKIACCCCVFCLVVLFIILGIVLGRAMFRKFYRNENDDGSDKSDSSEVAAPSNLSELLTLNEKLCRTITSNVSSHLDDNVNNIYIVKDEHNLTDEQACGVESILRLFPDKTVYLMNFNKKENKNYTKCTSEPNYLGLLMHLYKNRLQMVMVDKKEYLKNTPLRNFTKSKDDFQFMSMLLTAYKYGGLVISPDLVMTRRDLLECFPEETVVDPLVIFSPHKCDQFLHYLMQSFKLCGHTSTLESVLTQSVELFSKSQPPESPPVRRLTPSEVSHNAREPSGSFLKLNRFCHGNDRWVSEISLFCKQVVQAYLGIRLNEMEVEEETWKMKSYILGNKFGHLQSQENNTVE